MERETIIITLALFTLLTGMAAGIYQHYKAIQAQKEGKTSAMLDRQRTPES